VGGIDQMRLTLPDDMQRVDLDIFDTMGRIIMSKKNVTSQDIIDISALSKGSYIARFKGKNIDENQRIVIGQ